MDSVSPGSVPPMNTGPVMDIKQIQRGIIWAGVALEAIVGLHHKRFSQADVDCRGICSTVGADTLALADPLHGDSPE